MQTIIGKKHVTWELHEGEEREVVRLWIAVTSASDLPTKRSIAGLTLNEGSRAWDITGAKNYGWTETGGWAVQPGGGSASGNIVTIKGTVASTSQLPSNAEVGWLYFVKPLGATQSDEYVYTEEETWDKIGSTAIEITVDSSLSSTSENPVQNKVINAKVTEIETTIGDINTVLEGVL